MRKTKGYMAVRDFVRLFFSRRLPHSGAALAYYMTLSIFPVIICLSVILGSYDIDPNAVRDVLAGVLPSKITEFLSDYLAYVNQNSTPALFWAGVVLFVSTTSGAFRCITSTMADIQGRTLFSGFWGTLFSFAFSLIFAVVMYLSVFIVVTGQWFIGWLQNFLHLPDFFFQWPWLRFIFMLAILFLIIYIIYWLCTPKGIDHRVFPGAVITAVVMVALSIVFSWFIEMSSNYSLVYGSIASLIIMMIWLYFCSTVLLSGNLLNFVINKYSRGFYDYCSERQNSG